MKILGIPKPIVAGIIFLLSSVLVVTPATAVVVVMPAPPDACTDANAQARDDTNNIVWMLGGCLATVLTVLAAQIIEPEPPASALLGQSPEYVAQYTDCYQ